MMRVTSVTRLCTVALLAATGCGSNAVLGGQAPGDAGPASATEAGPTMADAEAADAEAAAQSGPVKIVFVVDTSGSLIVTDPSDARSQAVLGVIQQHQGPGVSFAVIAFSSPVTDLTAGFTATPDTAVISQVLNGSDDLSDDQGALGALATLLSKDATAATAAVRACTRYVVLFLSDGLPDPVCSAEATPCGPLTCQPHTHCTPTEVVSDAGQTQNYTCAADYPICTVPKSQWATAFSPPVSTSLYPGLADDADYNQPAQILGAVGQIVALKQSLGLGSVRLYTRLILDESALTNPLATPFGLDEPAARAFLTQMAQSGGGTFGEDTYTGTSAVDFSDVDFAPLACP